MTFSIVARDPETGDLGVAVASKFLAVGAMVPHARAGVGAIATQADANLRFGPEGLAALEAGADAPAVLEWLVAVDPRRDERQLGIVDARGGSASWTGSACGAWAGHQALADIAVQGNILAGPQVLRSLLDAYGGIAAPFPERLVAALEAADRAGGDRRGRQAAALLVVRAGGGYGGGSDRWIDLRVDDHPRPVNELARLLAIHRRHFDRPGPVSLLPLDAALATDIRDALTGIGRAPGRDAPEASAAELEARAIGAARPMPEGWDLRWQGALLGWMGWENLEERTAAVGWIDPLVLRILRERARPDRYASKRRKIATAFWPPKPKPLIIAVSTRALRATSGT